MEGDEGDEGEGTEEEEVQRKGKGLLKHRKDRRATGGERSEGKEKETERQCRGRE